MKGAVPRTLRGRLALWYALLLTATLLVMATVAWFIAGQEDESPDPAATAARVEEADNTPQKVLLAFAVGIPPALAIAVGGGAWITRRSLAPLDEVVRISAALDPRRLDARIDVSPGSAEEIVALVNALNGMLARIERSVETTKRFTADASHELRHPLSVLRSEIEVDLRRPREAAELRATMTRALSEVERMSRMVDSLLALARSDAGELALVRDPVDLGAAARRAIDSVSAFARTRQVRVAFETPEETWVIGDEVWLERLTANLVENSCKFTHEGGQVSLAITQHGSDVELTVDDDGPGVAPEQREAVFARFYRGGDTHRQTEGAGLGLPLSREIARLHGGDLVLEGSALGGLRARFRIPAVRT